MVLYEFIIENTFKHFKNLILYSEYFFIYHSGVKAAFPIHA